jgi:hypothetical protein
MIKMTEIVRRRKKEFDYANIRTDLVEKIDNQIINPRVDVLRKWGNQRAPFIDYSLRLVINAYIECPEILKEFETRVETVLRNKNKYQPVPKIDE